MTSVMFVAHVFTNLSWQNYNVLTFLLRAGKVIYLGLMDSNARQSRVSELLGNIFLLCNKSAFNHVQLFVFIQLCKRVN